MSDDTSLSKVNPQIVDAVQETTKAVIGPATSLSGNTAMAARVANGIAYQYVAQSSAMAVQDAGTYMRNVAAMAEAAMAVVMTKMLEAPPESITQWSPAIPAIETALKTGVTFFKDAGSAAAEVLEEFPSS